MDISRVQITRAKASKTVSSMQFKKKLQIRIDDNNGPPIDRVVDSLDTIPREPKSHLQAAHPQVRLHHTSYIPS